MACNRRPFATLLAAAALIGAAPTPVPQAPRGMVLPPGIDPSLAVGLQQLAAKDVRLASVAYRLQTSALSLCPQNRTAIPGLIIQDISQYRDDLRPAMAAIYNLGPLPAVTGIVPGGPADRAGIRPGDQVVSLDGYPLGTTQTTKRHKHADDADGDAFAAIVDQVSVAMSHGHGSFALKRGSASFTRDIAGTPACASTVQMDLSLQRNAGADGGTVTVSQGLVDFTRSDDELAFVVGHELAHNILGHRYYLDSTLRKGGLFGTPTRDDAAVRETEREADYWGLYLVAWAGYDVSASVTFWQRIAKAGWLMQLFSDGTHPGDRSRLQDLQREVIEIHAAQAAHRPLVPNYTAFEQAGK